MLDYNDSGLLKHDPLVGAIAFCASCTASPHACRLFLVAMGIGRGTFPLWMLGVEPKHVATKDPAQLFQAGTRSPMSKSGCVASERTVQRFVLNTMLLIRGVLKLL